MDRLISFVDNHRELINTELDRLLPRADMKPEMLHEAMRYSVMGGGKRIRPLLCLMSASVTSGEDYLAAMPAACALEFVHTYSLIHDDLPSMDNDDMRRGRLTCHKAFDEATAILAGDALLTLAFETISANYHSGLAAPAILELAKSLGSTGMVGGQALDIENEGKGGGLREVELIHRWKTGSLINASCRVGGIVGGGSTEQIDALGVYAQALGLMYQITDDLLDIEATSEELGKTAGKDAAQNKLTYPAVMGVEDARELAREKAAEAKSALKGFGKEALMLRLLADYIVERDH